jgi:hypothetical protein
VVRVFADGAYKPPKGAGVVRVFAGDTYKPPNGAGAVQLLKNNVQGTVHH